MMKDEKTTITYEIHNEKERQEVLNKFGILTKKQSMRLQTIIIRVEMITLIAFIIYGFVTGSITVSLVQKLFTSLLEHPFKILESIGLILLSFFITVNLKLVSK